MGYGYILYFWLSNKSYIMKNIIVLFGIIDYVIGLFLPWGPVGTNLESGFNNEASPGLLGIWPAIIAIIFALKSSKKSTIYTIVFGVIMMLYCVLVLVQTSKLTGNDYLTHKYGLYLMILGSFVVIFGSYKKLKLIANTDELV